MTQNVVTYTAVISASNPDFLLLPGMTATLQIGVSETERTLKIPSQALRFRPTGHGGSSAAAQASGTASTIWVLDESGAAAAKQVLLGKTDGNSVQVLSDNVQEGDKVVIGVATPRSRTGWLGLRLGY